MAIRKFYWDSCVFIDRIARTPGRIEALEQITDAAQAGNVIVVASTMCIAECYKIKDSLDSMSVQRKLINDYFDNPWIELVQINSIVAELAQDISREHGIKPPDAIHVATAILRNVEAMHTYDGSKSHSPLRYHNLIGKPPLAIVVPQRLNNQLPLQLVYDDVKQSSKADGDDVPIPAIQGTDAEALVSPQSGDGQADGQESAVRQAAAKSITQETKLGERSIDIRDLE